ncbi:MAG: trigger factor [Acetobacteraceae bacterium]|nr:trigger factor [Acetobacteraceae bacterium]
MQVTETLSEGLKRAFTVVVPAADIENRRTARLTDLGKTLRLPGFRPGKVPLPIVRQRYGTAVTAEVLEESVNNATRQVLSDRGLRPALQPKVDVISLDAGAGDARDLEFKVEVELLPEITLPDFSTIQLTRFKAESPPDQVEEALGEIAVRNRDLVEIPEEELAGRGAAKGEVLTIDYVGKLDGQPFPGGSGTGVDAEVGGTGFVPGFAEQLEGMKPGDTREIQVTFPQEYGNKDLAGKAVTFDITARRLRKPIVPTVDDALAEKIGFGDLAEMRDSVLQRFQREYEGLSRLRLKRDLMDALADRADFVAPQGMVDGEFERIWQRLEALRKDDKLDEDDKLKDEETLRSDYRKIAERRIKLGLLTMEIGRVHNISVSPEELNRALRVEASRFRGQEAQMMEMFQKYPHLTESIRGPIFEDKVIDFVLELANVTEQTVTPEELAEEKAAEPAASGDASAEGSETPDQPAEGPGSLDFPAPPPTL